MIKNKPNTLDCVRSNNIYYKLNMILSKQCYHCRSYSLTKQSHSYNYRYDLYRCDYCDRPSKWDKDFDIRNQKISKLLDEYCLNSWEERFCKSLLNFSCASDKQIENFNRIWKKYDG
jgi:hypothetical protein